MPTFHRSVSFHVPKRRPVSIVSAVSAGVSAAVANAIWCVPSTMRYWPAMPPKVASGRGRPSRSHIVIRRVGARRARSRAGASAHHRPPPSGRAAGRPARRRGTPAGVGPARVAGLGEGRPRLPAGSASIQPAYRRTPGRPSNLCEATRTTTAIGPTAAHRNQRAAHALRRCPPVRARDTGQCLGFTTRSATTTRTRSAAPSLPSVARSSRDRRAQPPCNPSEIWLAPAAILVSFP